MAKKKKKNIAVGFTPPSYDPNRIGEFIQARYGKLPAARQRALYDRFKNAGAEFGEDPTGQRTGLIFLSPEMRSRLPEGWGGDGVQMVGKARPQFDETKYEIGQNGSGRYFLRPLTEMSGLGPAQVAAIRQMDQRTQGQQAVIRANYNAAGDTTARDAQNLSAQLAAIPGAGGGGNPLPSLTASTQAGTDTRMADTARTERTLQAQRASMEAMMNAPAMRQMGESEAANYATKAAAARSQMIADFGSANARAAAEDAALNARLRGQDMTLMGNQLRTGAQVQMNNADNATSIARTQATVAQSERNSVRQMQTRLTQIDRQIALANQRNDVQRARLLQKARDDQQRRLDKVVKDVSALVQTDGRTPQQQRSQYVEMLVARGYPRKQAIAVARATIKG